jgi:hypothetical protein
MNRSITMRRAITYVVCAVFLCVEGGCTVRKVTKLDAAQFSEPAAEVIVGITTKAGAEVAFDRPGATLHQGVVDGSVKQAPYSIPIADVQRVWVERRVASTWRTVGLSVGIAVVAIVGIIAATKQSCPFVYSWDGQQYVFDAEPYGGAITQGLERDDYSELEHLREQDGWYRLLLTNEVDETQHTNLMELLVVDHPPGSHVVSDEAGHPQAYTQIQPLLAARDLAGNDLLPWLRDKDRRIWEPDAVPVRDGTLREELILTFPKPEAASQANLIANVATGLWGSFMIKKMVELHGRETKTWLAALDRNPQAARTLHAWAEREGTYRLPIEVEEPTGWTIRGMLPSGGPLLAPERVIALDVSRARGRELRIRLRPPVGFWAFNSFAVAYGAGQPVRVDRVGASAATSSDGRDILQDLAANDDHYYVMPSTTDRAEIAFKAPRKTPGMQRSVFLHTRGWYELHLRNDGEPDEQAITNLMTVPNAAAQFAALRYAEWRRNAAN